MNQKYFEKQIAKTILSSSWYPQIKIISSLIDGDIFLYGGYLRDLFFNKKTNEIDIKIVTEKDRFKKSIITLKNFLKNKNIFFFDTKLTDGRQLFRWKNKKIFIDFVISSNLDKKKLKEIIFHKKGKKEQFASDFTINAIHLNLKTMKLIQPCSKKAINDFTKNKLVINNSHSIYKNYWTDFLRFAYLSTKYPQLKSSKKTEKKLKKYAVSSEAKSFFYNFFTTKDKLKFIIHYEFLFAGLKYNPNKYIKILNNYGALDNISKILKSEGLIQDHKTFYNKKLSQNFNSIYKKNVQSFLLKITNNKKKDSIFRKFRIDEFYYLKKLIDD